MTVKTDDVTDSSEPRLKVEDLAVPEQELSAEEMEDLRGGVSSRGRTPGKININTIWEESGDGST